jgi:hypothetical protein
MLDKIGQKFCMKHAKRAVSFHLKNNKTCKTACFASMRNFAKQQVCFAKHETCFVSCFAKYETKLVLLETLTILHGAFPAISGASGVSRD